jgi:tRNA pseudouridine55 synthase
VAEAAGVLLVDKPEGPTSHDVVAAARRALRTRRVGHAGTLDPFASGLLLLCIGPATRLAEYATALSKHYDATLRLGTATDTDDRTGTTIASSEAWRGVRRDQLETVLRAQVGETLQRPPAFSAKKVAGERSYARARRGEHGELEAVPVRIHAIELRRFDPPDADFAVHCSSGTYIRAIARDAGVALGCHAHLSALRRTAIGEHRVEAALTLAELEPDTTRARLLPASAAVAHLPALHVDPAAARRLAHGQRVPVGAEAADAAAVAVTADGQLVAIARCEAGVLHPRKVFGNE